MKEPKYSKVDKVYILLATFTPLLSFVGFTVVLLNSSNSDELTSGIMIWAIATLIGYIALLAVSYIKTTEKQGGEFGDTEGR